MASLHALSQLMRSKGLATCQSVLTLTGETGQSVLENFVGQDRLALGQEHVTAFQL